MKKSYRTRSCELQGFTLIEVVIFIAIASVIFIAIVSLSVGVVQQTQSSKHKLYASRYADELAQWLRVQKDLSWQDFYVASQQGSHNYCVNQHIALDLDLVTLLVPYDPDICVHNGIINGYGPSRFKRTVYFDEQTDNTKSVKATITVSWVERGSQVESVQLETLFAPR